MTGISLGSRDPRADYAELAGQGAGADAGITGGAGGVPALFFGQDENQLMITEA